MRLSIQLLAFWSSVASFIKCPEGRSQIPMARLFPPGAIIPACGETYTAETMPNNNCNKLTTGFYKLIDADYASLVESFIPCRGSKPTELTDVSAVIIFLYLYVWYFLDFF